MIPPEQQNKNFKTSDVFLIGAGVMSSTLGALLKSLQPDIKIQIVERADSCSTESSAVLNNAGTGHAGFCELNYTPTFNNQVNIDKAIKVNEAFEKSKQFWAYLVKNGHIQNDFIHNVPHISFVHGLEAAEGFYTRFLKLKEVCLFQDMEFSSDFNTLKEWMPLVMEGRNGEPVAATRVKRGTDVNFANLTAQLLDYLQKSNTEIYYSEEVSDLYKIGDLWYITTINTKTKERSYYSSKFVFIGAGGASLPLLKKSGIPEAKGYGGFPVSGRWLVCHNEKIASKHFAKVYGKASIKNAPPMSVPHLDTRIINGKKCLLFGPYAGFSTKFLKDGSWTDLFKSIGMDNIGTMLSAGKNNMALTEYLIKEVLKSDKDRFKMLQDFYPEAKPEDWELAIAGQRVQVIKMVDGKGTVEFGTEIVSAADGSLSALLGASPGASTSVKIMLDIITSCFKGHKNFDKWMLKLDEIISSRGMFLKPLHQDLDYFYKLEEDVSNVLGLNCDSLLTRTK